MNSFSKNLQILNFMKIRPVRAKLFHADWQMTVLTKLIIAFRNFANAPKEETITEGYKPSLATLKLTAASRNNGIPQNRGTF